jgi:large subunit ribosomal protein L4e
MFAPTKIWRRWHVSVNVDQKRYATCSALAASAVAPLVLARGHRIEALAEVPLVVADADIDTVSRTKDAIALLKALGAGAELERVAESRGIRSGKGKARNRRYVQRRGPLLIHNKERGNEALACAFRNIQGVDLCNVNRLNLLQLAPGGHVGRFIIWTESAFKELDNVFGTRKGNSKSKSGFRIPNAVLTNADIGRIIGSNEVQSAIRARKSDSFRPRKRNPLKNKGAMLKLNPFALTRSRRAVAASQQSATKRKAKVQKNRQFVAQLLAPAVAPVRGEEEFAPF